ncbi:MAG: tRNA guanosine(34) transglycosylase Tgt [Phycisphaerae bacterium]
MTGAFNFDIKARSGRARRGRISTPHGEIDTPAFMPVGTRASVKAVAPEQVAATGAQIILANTYHLLLRPGPQVVRALGGLQKFTGWNRPMLTDSGGFQVFSLAELRKLNDDGVEFRSHIDGALVTLTPESSIAVQNELGADIIMAFDECPPLGERHEGTKAPRHEGKESDGGEDRHEGTKARRHGGEESDGATERRSDERHGAGNAGAAIQNPKSKIQNLHDAESTARAVQAAVRRTIAWAARSKASHNNPAQALYGIIQGGLDLQLRRGCLSALTDIGFDGYAIGGLSVGEPPPEMWALLEQFADELPADKPRYLMGVGTPRDLVEAVGAGIDQFDCVLPTRNGRKGYAFTSRGVLRLRNSRHKLDLAPIDPDCDCHACRNFSRGYLRHLFLADEPLGGTLVSIHNLAFYQTLTRQMRAAIEDDRYDEWKRRFLAQQDSAESEDTKCETLQP